MNPLHQSWLADEATARQRQVAEAQEYAARVHALARLEPSGSPAAEALLAAAERLRQSINQRRAERQEAVT